MADITFGDLLIAGEAVQASFQGPLDFFALKGNSGTTGYSSSLPGSPPFDSSGSGVTTTTSTPSRPSSTSTFAPFARLQSLSHSVSTNAISSPVPTSRVRPPCSTIHSSRSYSSLSSWEAVDWPSSEALTCEPKMIPIRTSSNGTTIASSATGPSSPSPQRQMVTSTSQESEQTKKQRGLSSNKKSSDHIPLNRIVITNFRIFQVEGESQCHLKAQVVLDSIASLHHHGHRITIALKFDPCQYVISQQPWGPPTVVEIFSLLRHATTIHVAHRFPFFHGPAVLEKHIKAKEEERKRRRKNGNSNKKSEESLYTARLWTAEEILDTQSESDSGSESEQEENFERTNATERGKSTKGEPKATADDPLSNLHTLSLSTTHHSSRSSQEARRRERILGWKRLFNLKDEFTRQGFDRSLWCITDWNVNYDLSPTYHTSFICPKGFLARASSLFHPTKQHEPRQLWASGHGNQQYHQNALVTVPSNTADTLHPCIRQLAEFRSNSRFPVVCWRKPQSGCVLIRSSQPMVGFLGARGHVDESFIRSILNAAAKQEIQRRKRLGISQKVSPKLCIMDARGYSSAIANGVHGGGHENPDNYLNASITFMSLANIHVIASSHLSLLKAVQSSADSTNWFSALENTAWLTHVSELLKAASSKDGVVGKMTREDSSVLVHCSDGWDRTTQLVSLAQIIMDPYFRTIQGLRALIEKEWLFYGHPFQARNDSQQQRFVKHHISSLGQDVSVPSAGAQERGSGGWASGGPPVLLSSPNGKSERLSAIPNLSSLSRPIWKKVANEDDGDSSAWTKSLGNISNPFSTGSSSEDKHESLQGLPTSRADISKADWSHPPRHSTDAASNATESYVYPPSSWNKSRLSKDAKAPTKDVNNPNVVQPKTNPSPIFLLFLTCLHHILEQHPDHFEYNDYLLLLLAKAASGFTPFGDFLFNSERERAQSRLRENTVSVWAWIDCHRGLVTHPGYIGRDGAQGTDDSDPLSTSVLEVQTGGRYISIWSEYYFDTLVSSATYPFDPSTIMSSPMFHPHAPTSRARNSLTTDFWRATLLTPSNDRGMPTVADFHFAQPVPLRANKRATLNSAAATQTFNPSYAYDSTTQHTQSIKQHLELVRWRHIRDQHENEHLLLVHFLRRKRKARVDQVFSKWAEWAKKQREVQTARDAGWIVDYNDAQNDTHRRRGCGGANRHVYSDGDNSEDQIYADGEQSVYGRTVRPVSQQQDKSSHQSLLSRLSSTVGSFGRESYKGSNSDASYRSASRESRRRTHTSPPELVVHAGRRGLAFEMERILDTSQEAFFGSHPVVHDDGPSEGSEQEDAETMGSSLYHQERENSVQRAESIYSDDGFDDLGFPVVSSLVDRRHQ